MEREKAALGLFLMLNEPTREMEKEAAEGRCRSNRCSNIRGECHCYIHCCLALIKGSQAGTVHGRDHVHQLGLGISPNGSQTTAASAESVLMLAASSRRRCWRVMPPRAQGCRLRHNALCSVRASGSSDRHRRRVNTHDVRVRKSRLRTRRSRPVWGRQRSHEYFFPPRQRPIRAVPLALVHNCSNCYH
jgi:hypothetical protein